MNGELSRRALGLSAPGAAARSTAGLAPAAGANRPDGGVDAAPRRVAPATGSVVVVLADIAPSARLWGYARFVLGRRPLLREAGARFAKQLGSGWEGGFGLRPSASRQGLLCVFDDTASAQAFAEESALVAAYRAHARELLVVRLRAYSCRGTWDGVPVPLAAEAPHAGRIAGLTRASIRLGRAARFWRRAPPAERSLAAAPGCVLAAGLGEAPLLRQATFSIWDSVADMDRYARTGAHLEAIRAARE